MFDERRELIETYRATPAILRALLCDLDDALLRERPDHDDWSIVEVVAHLADADERAHERVRRMRDEDEPRLEAYDQEALAEERQYRFMPLDRALDRFAASRAAHAETLAALDDAAWARAGIHEEVGPITIQALTAHMAAHDATHLAQIAASLAGH